MNFKMKDVQVDDDSELEYESATSEHSFEKFCLVEEKQVPYTSTNLITKQNLFLNDIQIEQLSKANLKDKYEKFIRSLFITRFGVPFRDPRAELKNQQRFGEVQTLVEYDSMLALAQFALEMHKQYMQRSDHSQPQEGQMEIDNLQLLSSRIVHDHMRNASQEEQKFENETNLIDLQKPYIESKKKRQIKEINKLKFQEIQYLKNVANVPITIIAKRMKVSYEKLRKAFYFQIQDPEKAIGKVEKQNKFKKLHQRAKLRIQQLIQTSKLPLQISDIQKDLKRSCSLNVCRQYLQKYLRSQLKVSYRSIRPIGNQHNFPSAKLQRQYAASIYIQYMSDNKRIINIDESVIRFTDNRKKGWMIAGKHNQVTNSRRLNSINIIAGISNRGEFFYTVNQGKTNQQTFILYICKLCEHLTSVDKRWRQDTIFMLDNAPYHRGKIVTEQLKEMKIPIMYLGPYHFKMAPIELFFSYIKSFDLNPLNTHLPTQQIFKLKNFRGPSPYYVKELAMHISRLSMSWIKNGFLHCLTAALEDLALIDL